LSRPVEIFPKFTATLGAAMKQETLLTFDDLVFTRDGDYRHLFDQQETFVNSELAGLYGVTAPSGATFGRTTLPMTSGRVGLLGQAGVLAARDHSDEHRRPSAGSSCSRVCSVRICLSCPRRT
jgi:Protein of unknown function (DUF1592)